MNKYLTVKIFRLASNRINADNNVYGPWVAMDIFTEAYFQTMQSLMSKALKLIHVAGCAICFHISYESTELHCSRPRYTGKHSSFRSMSNKYILPPLIRSPVSSHGANLRIEINSLCRWNFIRIVINIKKWIAHSWCVDWLTQHLAENRKKFGVTWQYANFNQVYVVVA